MRLDAHKFLEDVSGRYARVYFGAVQDLIVAVITGNKAAQSDARRALADTMRETMGMSEVLGAMIAFRDAAGAGDHFRMGEGFEAFNSTPVQTILPRVTFDDAVTDLVQRVPAVIRDAAGRTADSIAKLYSEGRVIAFARSAEAVVTQHAQDFIARALRDGLSEMDAGRGLKMAVDQVRERTAAWSEAYSRVAFRNNVNTAVTAGRFRAARYPEIRAVTPAFRFDAVGDGDTRDNHGAADGIIMSVENPEWGRIAPPLGHGCRCTVAAVSVFELEALGKFRNGRVIDDRVPSGAFPDEGFRHAGRPDLFMAE